MGPELEWLCSARASGLNAWVLIVRVPVKTFTALGIKAYEQFRPAHTGYEVGPVSNGAWAFLPEGGAIFFDILEEAKNYCEVRYRIEQGAKP